MSATIKRKHLVLTGLVIALGTAMFVNWYYTKPEAKSVNKAADETTTVSEQKASEGLEKLTKNITDESDIENLITAKLGGKCLVSLGESASVTVEKGYLTDEALTQIVDIVTAKSGQPSSKVTVVEAK